MSGDVAIVLPSRKVLGVPAALTYVSVPNPDHTSSAVIGSWTALSNTFDGDDERVVLPPKSERRIQSSSFVTRRLSVSSR
jgi:hypothetical protein